MRHTTHKLASLFSAFVLALVSVAALPQVAAAQGGMRMPEGGFRESCRDIRLDRDRLMATCRGKYGGWNRTSLDLRDCRGGMVENHDGDLVCEGGRYGGDRDDYGFGGLPRGGYRQSCRDIDVNRGVLTATCRNKDGRWVMASIDLRDCRGGSIENKRGILVCRP
jgi:hypothetical protein